MTDKPEGYIKSGMVNNRTDPNRMENGITKEKCPAPADRENGKKNVRVRINGVERPGTYQKVGATEYIYYCESRESSSPGAITAPDRVLVRLSDRRMEIRRTGEICSRMIFEEGRTIPAEYVTPYGKIMMDVAGTTLTIRRMEQALHIHAGYRLETNGDEIAQNTVLIEILHGEA